MMHRKAITLTELVVAAAVMSIVVGSGMLLFRTGAQTVGKGGSYLTNSIAAANLARQIEMDIQRSIQLEIISSGTQGEVIMTVPGAGRGEPRQIAYLWPVKEGMGISRSIEDERAHVFCADRYVEVLEFVRHQFDPANPRHGYQINLSVASRSRSEGLDDAAVELVNIKRFVYAFNRNAHAMSSFYHQW